MKRRGATSRISRGRLDALIRRFGRVRVLVVGDLMLDRFVWGRVERISPEAPVPVVQVARDEVRAGGAGNVVANVLALGGKAGVCGIVGHDAAGTTMARLLADGGADTGGIVVDRHRPTTEKTRIIAHHQQVVRLDREASPTDGVRAARRLLDDVLRRRHRYDVLVLSDYNKGVVDGALLDALAEAHRQRPFTWVVDPKRANFQRYRRASLVKPNREEAAAASGVEIRDAASLREAGVRLLAQWEAEAVLISRGEDGMALFRQGGSVREFPTVAREVFDVTGAGDTVIAACALALGAGGSLEEATVLANHAAGVAVGKVGTATVQAAELRHALRSP